MGADHALGRPAGAGGVDDRDGVSRLRPMGRERRAGRRHWFNRPLDVQVGNCGIRDPASGGGGRRGRPIAKVREQSPLSDYQRGVRHREGVAQLLAAEGGVDRRQYGAQPSRA